MPKGARQMSQGGAPTRQAYQVMQLRTDYRFSVYAGIVEQRGESLGYICFALQTDRHCLSPNRIP